MKNINSFLSSPWRSDLFGFNMASRGTENGDPERHPENRDGGVEPRGQWRAPQPGMQGTLALGHQVPINDALKLKIFINDKETALNITRNRWTPAFMNTAYRSDVDKIYYPNSGTIAFCEKKAILRNDVFVSHLKITNERREDVNIKIDFNTPFEKISDGLYSVDTQTVPRGLRAVYPIHGFVAMKSDLGTDTVTVCVPANKTITVRYSMAFAPADDGADAAVNAVNEALSKDGPFAENELAFNRWFSENVPVFDCEDPDVEKIYYYRFYLIYRSIHEPSLWIKDHPIPGKCMYESPYGSWFGTVIGLPIPWQIGESSWLKNTSVTENQIKNWSENRVNHQNYIQFTPWAVWQYYKLHGSKEWLASIYDGFAKYGKNIVSANEVPITDGSWKTGAEYQPAFYQYTDEPWDWRYDNEGVKIGFKRKAIYRADEISYTVLSLKGCAEMARELGHDVDCAEFLAAAEKLTDFIKEKLWDNEKKFFYGYDPAVEKRCDMAACYDGFAPYIGNIVGKKYFSGFEKLWEEDGFFSEYGALSAERSCPMFWYDNCIAGPTVSSVAEPHEYGCSWNGPVWPYANSVVSQALGTAAKIDSRFADRWLDFFKGYTELHFMYGDRATPVICEHYRPDDGASFSPFFDYFHSGWIDQFMHFYAGIQIQGNGVVFKPFAKDAFSLRGVKIGDNLYDFIRHEDGSLEKKRAAVK